MIEGEKRMSHGERFMKKCFGILVAVLLTAYMGISAYAVSDSVIVSGVDKEE